MLTPPPIKRSANAASMERWAPMLAELMKSPGHWVKIRSGIGKSTAASMTQDIKQLSYGALREFTDKYGGVLNATIRRELRQPRDEDYCVWAQWDPKRVPMPLESPPPIVWNP